MRQELENYIREIDKNILYYEGVRDEASFRKEQISQAIAGEAIFQLRLVKMKIQLILLNDLRHGKTGDKDWGNLHL